MPLTPCFETLSGMGGDAYIDAPFQDLVLIAAWTLSALVRLVEKSLTEPEAQLAINALEEDIRGQRASSAKRDTCASS